jgi:hypothetical protein
MSELGILYEEKHFSYINTGSEVQLRFFERWVRDRLGAMTVAQRADYRWYRLTKGYHIRDLDIYRDRAPRTKFNDDKDMANWDEDLYGPHYGYREDPAPSDTPRFYPGTNWHIWKPSGLLSLNGAMWYITLPF